MNTQRKWLCAAGILTLAGGLLALGVSPQHLVLGTLLLLCPGMMFFMCKGMGKTSEKGASNGSANRVHEARAIDDR